MVSDSIGGCISGCSEGRAGQRIPSDLSRFLDFLPVASHHFVFDGYDPAQGIAQNLSLARAAERHDAPPDE
jgi:hypothetical protein